MNKENDENTNVDRGEVILNGKVNDFLYLKL